MNKFEEITNDIDIIIGEDNIREILRKRKLRIYWGTTPSSFFHIYHIIPLLQIKKFVDNDCDVKILLADIHAYLDMVSKSTEIISFEVLEHRTDIHHKIIKYFLDFFKINLNNVFFIQGTSYQTREEYTMDVFKFNALCKVSQLKKAGEKILIQNEDTDPLMTSLLYPTLQALDIEYLDTDVFYGDSNQKGICMLANDVLEKMGYSKKGYLLSDMYSNLKNMDKISMIDSYEKISEKINRMNLQDILYLIEYIIFEICVIKNISLNIAKYYFNNFDDMTEKCKERKILISDIKTGVINFFEQIIDPIRSEFLNEPDLIQKLIDAKYLTKKVEKYKD
jgi:tyrosyl-tRNA synthetase